MDQIPFARPAIGDDEIDAVAAVLRSGWLTTGGEAAAFEEEFAAFVAAEHALAVNSATAGLHLALDAVGTAPGDVVIVPSLTFTATAEVVRYLGAEVAFADITADGLLVDPEHVERLAAKITADGKRLAAIIAVHLAGEVAPMEELRALATRYRCALIEDAAHAFPSRTREGYAGTLGEIGVYSFYANKTITTGEGGMVVTANPEFARRIRAMRLHGIDREAWRRYTDPRGSWRYDVIAPGYKYNMTDIAAAIGRVQLRRAEGFLLRRRAIAARYNDAFAPLERAGMVIRPEDREGHAWHLYILRVSGTSRTRDEVLHHLQEAGIGVSVHYTPLHRMSYWRNRYPDQEATLINTDRRFEEILSLPIYPDLDQIAQDRVVATLSGILENDHDDRPSVSTTDRAVATPSGNRELSTPGSEESGAPDE
ncbi:MAG: DegT/DnrJ/EryC1/StrS family aminotransferase [Alkalispirochaeta sp.]